MRCKGINNMEGFIKISRYAGMREDLVQAGGGNSSFKISDSEMVIKSSGIQLSDITKDTGYSVVNPSIIKNCFMGEKDIDEFTELDSKNIVQKAYISGGKPSIEVFLHAISGKYILHSHPIVVNVLTSRKGGMEILKELFPNALMIPYATPGIELAKTYFKEYKVKSNYKSNTSEIFFLQNHGLVVSADTADAVIETTENVTSIIEKYLELDFESYHSLTKIWRLFENSIVWKITDKNILDAYQKKGEMWAHTFCPDCVVFLGKRLLQLDYNFTEETIAPFVENYGQPVMISYCGNLYVVADSYKKAFEIQSVMSFSAQVMMYNEGYDTNLLSESEQNFLLNWDAEKYRKVIK